MLGYKKKQILLTEGKIDEVIDNYSHSYAIQYAEDSRTQDDIDAEEYILYYEHDVYDAVIDIVKKSEDYSIDQSKKRWNAEILAPRWKDSGYRGIRWG